MCVATIVLAVLEQSAKQRENHHTEDENAAENVWSTRFTRVRAEISKIDAHPHPH